MNDPQQGGGRIIGEVCHFVDFLFFLTGASPVEVETRSLPNPGQYSNDNIVCSLRFPNGSQATISYLANGDKSYSKERIEVFGGGNVAVLEDFRRLELVHERKEARVSLAPATGQRASRRVGSVRHGDQNRSRIADPVPRSCEHHAGDVRSRRITMLGQPISVPNTVPVVASVETNDLGRDDRAPDAKGLDRAS